MASVELTLIGKPDCHLCEDARAVVLSVVGELADGPGAGSVSVAELSILDDPALMDEYFEEIPVVLLNGRVHTIWRVDPARLRAALTELLEAS